MTRETRAQREARWKQTANQPRQHEVKRCINCGRPLSRDTTDLTCENCPTPPKSERVRVDQNEP
jgi:hypothetical protein